MEGPLGGFVNKGVTCFVGASLQLLLHVRPLCELLQSLSSLPSPSIMSVMAAVCKAHQGGGSVDLTPLLDEMDRIRLKHNNNRYHVFNTHSQQDASEYLDSMLDLMVSECPKVFEIFGSNLILQIKCEQCKVPSSITLENPVYLTVQLRATIQTAVDDYFCDSDLMSACLDCQEETEKRKETIVTRNPDFLLITVNRFVGKGKCTTQSLLTSALKINNVNYSLLGFVVHHGRSKDHGHYTSICKHNQWWHYDDTKISSVPCVQKFLQEDYIKQNWYIALYEKAPQCTPTKRRDIPWACGIQLPPNGDVKEVRCTPTKVGKCPWVCSPPPAKQANFNQFPKRQTKRKLVYGGLNNEVPLKYFNAEGFQDIDAIEDIANTTCLPPSPLPDCTQRETPPQIEQEFHLNILGRDHVLIVSNTPLKPSKDVTCANFETPPGIGQEFRLNILGREHVLMLTPGKPSKDVTCGGKRSTGCQTIPTRVKYVGCQTVETPTKSIACQTNFPLTSYEVCVKGDPKVFKYFTGVTPGQFDIIYDLMGGDDVCSKLKYTVDGKTPVKKMPLKISLRSRLFLVLVRLRRDLSLMDISHVLGISVAQAGVIFYTWVRALALSIDEVTPAMFISAQKQNKKKPPCFLPYKNLRIILDCAEFPIEKSSNLQQQSNTFSDYKHYNTVKFLIGISCYGGVSFISDGYEGRITDEETLEKSGFYEKLEDKDAVMADRGFKSEEKLAKKNCVLIKPPEKKRKTHFTARQEVQTKSIACVRIYVEHTIGKIKDWLMLAHRLELDLIPIVPDLVKIAAFIYNFNLCYIGQPKKDKVSQPKKDKLTKK